MTKLTTELLEKKIKSCIEIENCEVMMPLSAAQELLAFRNAAKNPVGYTDDAELRDLSRVGTAYIVNGEDVNIDVNDGRWFPVYRAPVLPKQPDATITNEGDITKIIKAAEKLVRCKGRYHSEQNYRALAALFGVTVPDFPPLPSDEAPAQPVTPEQPEPTISFYRDGIIAAAKWVENQRDAYDNEHGQSDPDTGAFEFGNDAQLEYSTTLSEIAEGIRSLHPTSAQPVSEPYKLPDGWKLVPIEPTAAMFHAFNDCDYGRKSMRERYIQMIEAAPAQESE